MTGDDDMYAGVCRGPAQQAPLASEENMHMQATGGEVQEVAPRQHQKPAVPPLVMSLTRLPEELPPSIASEFEVCPDLLGEGAYAAVRRLRHRQTGDVVALKVVEKYPLQIRRMLPQLQREVHIQARLNHRNILKLLQFVQDDNHVYMILEYCPGGSLRALACRMPDFRFPEGHAACYFGQILLGVDHMHRHGVVHRDLKHDNVLLTATGEVRICDFGWCAEVQAERALLTTCGTPNYWAPEIFEGKPQSFPLDLWALGNLVYELLVGHAPFWGSHEELMHKVLSVDLRYPPGLLSAEAINLLYCCLQREPRNRVPCYRLLGEHPWIRPVVVALAERGLCEDIYATPQMQPELNLPLAQATLLCLPTNIPIAMNPDRTGPYSFVPPVLAHGCEQAPQRQADDGHGGGAESQGVQQQGPPESTAEPEISDEAGETAVEDDTGAPPEATMVAEPEMSDPSAPEVAGDEAEGAAPAPPAPEVVPPAEEACPEQETEANAEAAKPSSAAPVAGADVDGHGADANGYPSKEETQRKGRQLMHKGMMDPKRVQEGTESEDPVLGGA